MDTRARMVLIKLHAETGREFERVYVTVPAAEADALLPMISATARGVRVAREGDEQATGFMFVPR